MFAKKLPKGVFRLGYLATLAVIAMLIAQPIFVAQAACSGSTCTGKDPIGQGCSGSAYTVGTNYVGPGTYRISNENRYSTTCNANWGRVTNTSGTSRYMKEDTFASGATAQTYPTSWTSGTQWYTNMINGNLTVCTVGYIDTDNNSSTGPYESVTSSLCY